MPDEFTWEPVLLRLQMKIPNLDTVRLLGPRLGFGSDEVCADTHIGGGAPVPPPAEAAPCEETQVSLANLAEQLESEQVGEPTSPAEAIPPVETPQQAEIDPEPPVLPEAPRASAYIPQKGRLEGRKVAAIGFGRQDIASLAVAMLEERARIQFLPQGDLGAQGECDLFLLNCSSAEVLKRDASFLRAVLASGTPAIVIGSRAALNVLRAGGDPRTWDFAAKPFHMDELLWRAATLIARCEALSIPRKLPPRVVIADNDPFASALIESALAGHGFTCELAEDGEAAWKAIEKTEPGVVILDLTLPNRDGFQLMADIRRLNGRKPKVVVLSARQTEPDILRAFALGADDYITKPFSPLELHARLTRLVGGLPEHA